MELGFRNGSNEKSNWIVAYDKGTLEKVGTVLFMVRGNKCYVDDVFVAPQRRGRGNATRLVQAMLDHTKLPYRELRWGVRTDDGVALKRALDRRFGKRAT